MRSQIQAITIVLVLASFLTGCSGPPYAMKPAGEVRGGDIKVRLGDKAAHKTLRLISEDVQVAPDGQMTVTVEILNCKGDPFWAEVRTVFLDEAGKEIRQDETNWRPEYFPANDTRQLVCRSLTNRAKNYRMTLREKEEQP